MRTNQVLLVDDKEENLYFLSVLLKGSGFETACAHHGTEALEMARRAPPILLIADILMPVMDGFALCREWNKDPDLKSIPFVFYTATYTDDRDQEFAISLGAKRFLVKPMEPDDLIKAIRETIQQAGTPAAAAESKPSGAAAAEEESVYLRQYNESLIRKLELKMEQLEQTNRELKQDIAHRKRTEAINTRLVMAAEQASDAIVITDAEGAIQYVNAAFTTMTGYPREEVLGKNPRIVKSGRQDEAFYRELWQTIASGKKWRRRLVNKRKDGTLYTEEAAISPLRDAEGRIINFVSAKRDITERLQMEDQLRQSQKMDAMGQLSGGIAHDFNNLLSVIKGYSQLLLKDETLKATSRHQIEEILKAGERASSLTRQLLVFSRRQVTEPQIIDLNALVADTSKMLQRLIRKNISLVITASPSLWPIKADPGQLEQVIMNLVVNARDAMPEAGTLTITTENARLEGGDNIILPPEISPGPYVLLSVSDTGCGMDEKVKERIFEPFFTTKEAGKGTGLGLSIVYGIVKQSEGFINVRSEPSKGTTFNVYLPRHAGKVSQTQPKGPEESAARGSETILLVEDDPALLDMTRTMLESFGYRVLPAATSSEAIRLASANSGGIHLLMTDTLMPDMNGQQIVQKILSICPRLKHLFLSGYTDSGIASNDEPDAAAHLIQKPFTRKELSDKVRETLDGK